MPVFLGPGSTRVPRVGLGVPPNPSESSQRDAESPAGAGRNACASRTIATKALMPSKPTPVDELTIHDTLRSVGVLDSEVFSLVSLTSRTSVPRNSPRKGGRVVDCGGLENR